MVITINYDDNIKNFICPPGHNSTSGDSPPAQTPAPTSLNVPAINIIGANQRVSEAAGFIFILARKHVNYLYNTGGPRQTAWGEQDPALIRHPGQVDDQTQSRQ